MSRVTHSEPGLPMVIPFEVFPFSRFYPVLPEFPKISVPFVHSYSARLFTTKRLSLHCVSLLVGSVGGRFRIQLPPCRWKRIKLKFCGRHLCFSVTCMIRDTSVLIMRKNVDADCWFPWRNVNAAAAWKKKLSPSPKRKNNFQVVR